VSSDITIKKEMGISHRDFFRILARALGSDKFDKQGTTVVLTQNSRRLTIKISEESHRRIASIVVPMTEVILTFSGYDAKDFQATLDRFDRYFRKGGG
jgi:hypothetical protein